MHRRSGNVDRPVPKLRCRDRPYTNPSWIRHGCCVGVSLSQRLYITSSLVLKCVSSVGGFELGNMRYTRRNRIENIWDSLYAYSGQVFWGRLYRTKCVVRRRRFWGLAVTTRQAARRRQAESLRRL